MTKQSLLQRGGSWALTLALGVGVYAAASAWRTRELIAETQTAPDFALRDLSGQRVQLAELRGKRVLVHFWATWCFVCQREVDALNAVARGLAPDEVLLTVVADSEDAEHVRRYVAEHGIEYRVLLADRAVLRNYRVDVFPTNYFIAASGQVADTTVGLSTRWGLASRLQHAR